MTIRRRLSLSFAVILFLFTVNLIIYFWSNQRRQATVETLRRAVTRQALISGINQSLNDIQKQVSLLSQVATEGAATGADPAEVGIFNQQLTTLEREISQLDELADPETRPNIESFRKAYRDLSSSWRVFYENFGKDQTKAITELVVRAEPLTQEVIQQRLPQLQQDENKRVDAASSNFYEVAQLTNRITILIFAVSAALAIGVGVVVPGQMSRGLNHLKNGATSIGSGNLRHRIYLKSKDELADLAKAFNEMTGRLSAAHDLLTRVNEQEKKKSEELEKALDQLRKAQDQLVVQQKLASLGSLTAGIAHEIKNPLNFVTNFAEVSVSLVNELRESTDQQSAQMDPKELENIRGILNDLQQNVAKIQEHGKRADGIVRNMLMHSRGHAGDHQPTNLNSLLAEYVKLAYHGMRAQNHEFNITIQEHYDTTLEPLSVVAHDLGRVFLNITNNACYAAYEKKKKLGNGFSPTISVKTKNLGSSAEIRIRDNGDGIPESVRQRIFEPFFTTKPTGSGTGLGLSMSFEIVVQQHKGQLQVETEPGEYAEFIITLPKTPS